MWLAGMAAGVLAGAVCGTAWGTVLDAAGLERAVRADVAAFRVATGAEGAVLPAKAVEEMPDGDLRMLALALQEGDGERSLALYGELARRELPWEERVAVLHDVSMQWGANILDAEWRAAAEAFGLPLREAWKAGAIPEAQRRAACWELMGFLAEEWAVAQIQDREAAEATAEAEEWEKQVHEMCEVWDEVSGGNAGKGGDEATRGRDDEGGAGKGDGGMTGGEPDGEAEWRLRKGVELSMLGRHRDASAEWREGARVAEEAGEEELARELRAALAVYGDWGWRRAERRALCEAEIAAGSPWKEHLLETLADSAEASGEVEEATELALEGWWEYGRSGWAERTGRLVRKGGGADLSLWHRVCGERLEAIPAREERSAELRSLVEFRWVLGELFPGRVEASLEGDLARLRERAAEAAESGEADGEETAEPEAVEVPGARWRFAEPSWESDPAVPQIERDFNHILQNWGYLRPSSWRMWREKWSLEERRALRVDGVGAEFVSRADEFAYLHAWEEEKEAGLAALAECKVQEGYDGGRLMGVLSGLIGQAVAGNPPTAAEAEEITGWTAWARQVARGDAEEEDRVAALELARAELLGDEAAVRRLAGDARAAASLCEWVYPLGLRSMPWSVLARAGGKREAVRMAILHVRMSGETEFDAEVAALMDVMTAGELAELREALRLGAVADAAWAVGSEQPVLQVLAAHLGHAGVREWRNAEPQLRLARLEEQGADGGAEGQAAAVALGTESVRGTLVRLRWRLGGGVDASDGEPRPPSPPDGEDAGDGVREEDGRWREWCACVGKFAGRYSSGRGGSRWMPGGERCGDHRHGGLVPPWVDRMVQRGLQEALSAWGAEATEEEREGIAAALERMGAKTGEEVYGDWVAAAEAAGDWAVEALERGRAAALEREEEAVGSEIF